MCAVLVNRIQTVVDYFVTSLGFIIVVILRRLFVRKMSIPRISSIVITLSVTTELKFSIDRSFVLTC
jgi:hypothetical protein